MKRQFQRRYRALQTKDAGSDGQFFFAVKTTGIFCRPVCPSRLPNPENVVFFESAEEARKAGFRACLRCRPDSAPGSAAWAGSWSTIARALRILEVESDIAVSRLASKLGLSDRQLRRLFVEHLGAPPGRIRARKRIDLSRKLLRETPLSITEIAYASGFSSLRRFNSAFADETGSSPRVWRKGAR